MDDPMTPHDPVAGAMQTGGPLTMDLALALLERADELMASGDYGPAAQVYQRVAGFDDAQVTAAAWLGLGDALFRLDLDRDALLAWSSVTQLPETRSTYRAWRNIAAARVRAGDLKAATAAYREAERRAPAEDRAEIAGRLGWLAKEMGDRGAARRYFARARGDGPALPISWLIIGLTLVTSLIAMSSGGEDLFLALWLDKAKLAAGELYRLVSVTLVHDPSNLLHLFFNMYALYMIGPLVEGIWGSRLFVLFYVLTAAAASTLSFVLGPSPAVGASGAVFGLIGVLIAGTRAHDPILDRRARAIVPQLGVIVLINLGIGFLAGGRIDNAAHVGGLIAGLWLGLVVPPGKVPTLRSLWQQPAAGPAGSPRRSRAMAMLPPVAGVLVLVVVITLGLALGGVSF